ncbi:uncharacterized protein LOC107269129 [Cephus cinctus]|uniref:Uncharacterized protein LOC107269129 n=1 Tax=Cephus cinctus TaxID=211228 RepID=A0AAJ7RKH7_CEPCN|nr:uncharacterized protein LOC107269129 [Cephus cinctus]
MEVLRFFCFLVVLCRIGHSSASYYLLGSLIEDVLSSDFEKDSSEEDTVAVKGEDKEDAERWLSHYCDYLYDFLGIALLQELTEELADTPSDFGVEPETQVEKPHITYNDSLPIPAAVYNDILETTLNSGPSTADLPAEPPSSSVNKPQFITSSLIPSVLPPGQVLPVNQTTEDSLTIALASDLVDDTN